MFKVATHLLNRSENSSIFNSGHGGNSSSFRFLVDVVLSQTRDRPIDRHQIPESGFSIANSIGGNPKESRSDGMRGQPCEISDVSQSVNYWREFCIHTSSSPLPAHAIFDVVVDDEIQLLISEAVVLGQYAVDLVDYRLAQPWVGSLNSQIAYGVVIDL